MIATSFGEQLRLAREARGITLRDISEQTRISTRYLEAIESGDLKRLPGGIFNRSFIKAYARYVGFDETEALEAYARTAREMGASPDDVSTTPYKACVYTDGGARSPLITLLLTILILAILSLAVYAVLHWYQRSDAPSASEKAPTSTAPAGQSAPSNVQGANNPAAVAIAGFVIQIRALDKIVLIKTRVDEQEYFEHSLSPGEVKEFKPTQTLSIRYAKSVAKSLELTINGRPANLVAISPTNPVEMVITKDDFEKYLQ